MLRPLSGLFLLATLAVGCGPSQITLKLQGSEDLNPDPLTGTPSPVLICAYFTKTREKIQALDFDALWVKEGKDALAGDLVNRSVPVDVNVNKNRDWPLSPGDGANFVTVVARFNKIEGSDWKKTMDFDQAQSGPIRIGASTIQVPPPRP
jgi:type VI secretion system VasD/TssJ family lipoprotein